MSIELENVYYRDRTKNRLGDLNGLTLSVKDGELVGIIGDEDSGKSALGALTAGLISPDSGSVTVSDSSGDAGCVALVMRRAEEFLCEATVEKEVGYALNGRKPDKSEREEAVRRALESVGLEYERVAALSPFELPFAEKKRVAIAAALVSRPKILILDEPTDGADAVFAEEIQRLLKKLKSDGVTILLLTADPDLIAETADRVVILQNGKAVRDGNTKKIFSEYYDLVHLGVEPPQVRRCVQLLRIRGVDMPENIISYKQFIDRLKIIMWRKTR